MGMNELRGNGGPRVNRSSGGAVEQNGWYDDTKYVGVVSLLTKQAQQRLWDVMAKELFGCLAVNIVQLFKHVDDERADGLLDLTVNNAAPQPPAFANYSCVRRWSVGSAGSEGRWVKLTDGSVLHFQEVGETAVVSAWLWAWFIGRREIGIEDSLLHASLGNIPVVSYTDDEGKLQQGIEDYLKTLLGEDQGDLSYG